jgi:hypothetical protein
MRHAIKRHALGLLLLVALATAGCDSQPVEPSVSAQATDPNLSTAPSPPTPPESPSARIIEASPGDVGVALSIRDESGLVVSAAVLTQAQFELIWDRTELSIRNGSHGARSLLVQWPGANCVDYQFSVTGDPAQLGIVVVEPPLPDGCDSSLKIYAAELNLWTDIDAEAVELSMPSS